MTTDQAKILREQITAFGLFDKLMERMQQVRIGGVKRSTIYKAFSLGSVTPVCALILDTAQNLLDQHRESAGIEAAAA